MLPLSSTTTASSPPSSAANNPSRHGRKPLYLDLSNLPPPPQPSPPSNTLLITDLHDLSLFQPSSLDAIKAQISRITPLNSFSPLPSLRRIVCSFTSIDAAVRIRQVLDGEAILGKSVRARVYFGENTPVEDAESGRKRNLLEAPKFQKQFFISPPPSPPHGWMMRNEEPPNKEVHAADLAEALGRLGSIRADRSSSSVAEAAGACQDPDTPMSPSSDGHIFGTEQETPRSGTWQMSAGSREGRQRSGSTVIYDPEYHGGSPHLPAVMVEDTSVGTEVSDFEMDASPTIEAGSANRVIVHTARPPVELME
ncbi:hypothetical protein PABG_05275 [Paracoccidioides brasiliensis Pb03]|uniref:Calcineurin binding protein n=1 Tax=Paracoccidioides brasiliensis (strain Pb18) TaxID=502780 RepID=C1GIA0_PARBD|nr:uncharacterized protein PADG_06986 [Paracoccidioides brasiliensis Pb18]EEH23064.1 hypothetical protein PABG_05275 [Paracoccidioides brasiliensis Pb03]EEH42166.1 hypothetical protein PADG_06986 [Paracoccidioides brasiliensis Pb18]ODH49191.1 hypothetical protein GX48_04698 [Paracoccidioides brasiliensis]